MSQKRSNDDFAQEIEAHIQIEADHLVDEGLSPDEALLAARKKFGNVTAARETFYESNNWNLLASVFRDVRYAARSLKNSPIATAVVIVSLALGIGFNTAIFSLADQALLRPLPVEQPERLVQIKWDGPFQERGMGSVGYGTMAPYLLYKDLREENEVFDDVFASGAFDVQLTAGQQSEPVTAEVVSGSYFPTLGVRPVLGRLLSDEDDRERDGHPVLVLSYEYWQRRFGGSPGVIGQTVLMNNYPMTVIGVAEQRFRGIDWSLPPDIWATIMMKTRVTPTWDGLNERRTRFLHVFGRLKPGIDAAQAQAQLQPWFQSYLQADTEREGWPQVTEQQLQEFLASDLTLLPGSRGETLVSQFVEQPVLILLAATAMVLLLTCLNVANLSLARVLARARVTALRSALGASRLRVMSDQIIESSLLAAIGCTAGLLLAPLVSRWVLAVLPTRTDGGLALSADLDLRVLLLAAAITAVATLIAGIAPALWAASVNPITAMRQQTAGLAGGFGLRKALVVGQFAFALVLLVGAGLFAQTLTKLRDQGPGYSTSNLLTFKLAPIAAGYPLAEGKPLMKRVLAAVEALPDVERAAVGRFPLLNLGGWGNPVTIQTDHRFATDENSIMNAVSPDFFETLGIPLLSGRAFDERDANEDSRGAMRVAIVNEEFGKRYLNGESPLGAMTGIGAAPDTATNMEIVGVVADFQDHNLREPEPQIYFPLWQRGVEQGAFYVRTRSASTAAVASIRDAVRKIDPSLALLEPHTMDNQLDRMLASERLLSSFAWLFAAVATILAMIGLYGVLSFSAARRMKEIGIRLALGAPRVAAGGLIVREAALLALIGLAIALPISWMLGRLIESQLYGVSPMDGVTIATAAGVLLLVCLAASAVPARKASSVDPLEALRAE